MVYDPNGILAQFIKIDLRIVSWSTIFEKPFNLKIKI